MSSNPKIKITWPGRAIGVLYGGLAAQNSIIGYRDIRFDQSQITGNKVADLSIAAASIPLTAVFTYFAASRLWAHYVRSLNRTFTPKNPLDTPKL